MAPMTSGLGWIPDLPDIRDYDINYPEIAKLLGGTAASKHVGGVAKAPAALPSSMDLRATCSPVENQGSLGSCTAQAAVGLVEYYERRASGGTYIDGSRLFVYKVSRKLLGWTGDTGAYLRTAMKALVMCGAPPESYWPYDIAKYEDEPTAFVYALAANYKSVRYYRLDLPGESKDKTLARVKQFVAAKLPAMFGFTVYNSIWGVGSDGNIPFPSPSDTVAGGHAIVAVGYDDKRKIGSCTGALLIRNSWGSAWGDHGYGWLPYEYVKQGLADDFWSVLKQDWVDTGLFK